MNSDGIHPLSESQLDHFMFCLNWSANPEGQRVVVDLTSAPGRAAEKILTTKQVLELQRVVREMIVSDHAMRYAVRAVRATRPTDKRAPEMIKKHVHAGAGPRAAQHLVQAAKAHAVLDGRLMVDVSDVRAVALPALNHRLCASFSAGIEGWTPLGILEKLLAEVEERDTQEA
jgi:MoxR-like ATPase